MMKYLASLALALAVAHATPAKRFNPQGIDVSGYQPDVDWTTVVNNGVQFVYIKATEGTSYISPSFSDQYIGATDAGLIRGAYHFAHPDESTGATQATYFLENEDNPDGDECYDLAAAEMVSWIQDFSDTYEASTGRYPVIYTTTDWWTTCTGNSADFGANNALWIADYASTLGSLPAGWAYTSFWQYDDVGPNPGDVDLWNGEYAGLQSMAYGYAV